MKLKRHFILILSLTITFIYAAPISIFYTGDTHSVYGSQIDKEKGTLKGGYLVLEEILNQERSQTKNGIYVDTGDQQTGTIFSSLVEDGVHGGAVIEVFNQLALDASVFGNHEFDFSYTNTRDLAKKAKFPFVCTNLIDKTTRQSVSGIPYTILERDNITIGIFGVTLEKLPEKVKAENVSSVTILPPVDAINKYLEEVDQKTNLIIVLTHQGFEADSLLAVNLDNRIDLIIGGHDHIKAETPYFINGKYLLYSGSHLNYLGLAELEVEEDKIISLKNQLIPLEIPEKDFDTPLAKYIQEKTLKIEEEMSIVIGYIPEDWIPDKYQSTALSRWIANALKTEYERIYHPDMAIINNGGLRKTIPAGPVTLRDLNELLPFNNTVVVFSCYGKDLLSFFSLNELHSKEKPFDICEYTHLDSIEPDKVYRVISHDYIAGQWDKYLGFKPFDVYDTGEPFLDAIIRQIQIQYSPNKEEDWD